MNKQPRFSAGDRVMVVANNHTQYNKLPVGAVGTVFSVRMTRYDEFVRVVFDEYHNGRSCYDAFGFWGCDLVQAPALETTIEPMFENKKEETPMNTMYNEKNCRVAGVILDPHNSKEYAYALFLNDVSVGDKVVVRNSNGSLAMGRLASVDNHPHEKVKNGCEVICVIDMTEYNKRQEQFAKVAELRKKMDARVKALQDIALYEMLAKDDPELKDLLAEFKTVSQ